MKFRRNMEKSWTRSVIDMTPLIDVVFLLLLFFLLTAAPTPDPTLAVQLPKATSGAVEHAPKELEIVLREGGDLFVRGEKVTMEDLRLMLKKVAKKDPSTKVIFRGDRKSYYEKFIELLETVNSANLPLAVAVSKKEISKEKKNP
jgi:biopolymer transport protein ExbD